MRVGDIGGQSSSCGGHCGCQKIAPIASHRPLLASQTKTGSMGHGRGRVCREMINLVERLGSVKRGEGVSAARWKRRHRPLRCPAYSGKIRLFDESQTK